MHVDISYSEGTDGLYNKIRTQAPKAGRPGQLQLEMLPILSKHCMYLPFILSLFDRQLYLKFRGKPGNCLILCPFKFCFLVQNIPSIPSQRPFFFFSLSFSMHFYVAFSIKWHVEVDKTHNLFRFLILKPL